MISAARMADPRSLDDLFARHRAAALKSALIAHECEDDLLAFVRHYWRVCDPEEPFVPGWPLEAIADHLMAVTDGSIKRLLINVMPGSTKSLMTDVFWPAWEWGPQNLPHMRYIAAAYTASLTRRDNTRFRRVLMDTDYRANWGHRFNLEKIGEVKVENDRTGWKLATSVEGVGTGERGNRIIIDDANNPYDVESETVRESTNLWLREVMPDRLNNLKNDAIVVIAHRSHEADASGTLLDVMGRDYVHLMIPMEYEPTRHCVTVLGWEDPRGIGDDGKRLPGFVYDADGELTDEVIPNSPAAKADGRLAWPERFPRVEVERQKAIKGAYAYAAQYQQSPVPRGGGLIQRLWWRRWSAEQFPDFGSIVASLDTAIKEKEENDWNALTVWGAFAGDDEEPLLMLRKAWRMRGSLGELAMKVYETCKALRVDTLLIEDKARGHDVAAELRRLFADLPMSIILVDPAGDKVSRVKAVQPLWSGDCIGFVPGTDTPIWSGGMVFAPGTEEAEEVIEECAKFPRDKHDDYVDSCTQALLWMRQTGVVVRRVEHLAEEFERKKLENVRPLKPLYDV